MRKILSILIFFSLFSCSENSSIKCFDVKESSSVQIVRFDKAVHSVIENSSLSDKELRDVYPVFYPIYIESILGLGNVDSIDCVKKMMEYFSNPDFQSLYRDVESTFSNINEIQKDLKTAFHRLQIYLPQLKIPTFYVHVSGLNQSVVVGEGFISLSLDKYLGENYPLYQNSFYSYERKSMQSSFILKDYLAAWYFSEYPLSAHKPSLIDQMLYNGRLYYLYSLLLPKQSEYQLLGFTKDEFQWLEQHESYLWESLVNQQKLFDSDQVFISKWLGASSFSYLTFGEIPGKVGIWLGYRIIQSYVAMQREIILDDFLIEQDYNQILIKSKYHPHL